MLIRIIAFYIVTVYIITVYTITEVLLQNGLKQGPAVARLVVT